MYVLQKTPLLSGGSLKAEQYHRHQIVESFFSNCVVWIIHEHSLKKEPLFNHYNFINMGSKIIVQKQSVGADFAKDSLRVCFYQWLSDGRKRIKASRKIMNTLAGFKVFQQWAEKLKVEHLPLSVILEPTGVYHENFLYFFNENSDYQLCLVIPNRSKAFAKSLGINTKTDKVDAKVLGLIGLERDLKIWQPISPKLREIKQLCRERISLVERKTAISNRKHAVTHGFKPNKAEVKRLDAQLKLLEKQIKRVEKMVEEKVNVDPFLKSRIDFICEIRGFRMISVATVVAETNGFQSFESRGQVVSFAGYDVVQRESGSSIKGKTKISKKGNKFIRKTMYFCAVTAAIHETELKKLYERVLERTQIKMKANVAVQRKLLILIYTIFKKNEKFDPNYLANLAKEKEANNEHSQTNMDDLIEEVTLSKKVLETQS